MSDEPKETEPVEPLVEPEPVEPMVVPEPELPDMSHVEFKRNAPDDIETT